MEKENEKLWNAISLDSLVQKAQHLERRLQSSREEALFRKAQLDCVQRRCEGSQDDPSCERNSFGAIDDLNGDYNQLLADYEQLASYAIASQNEVKRLRVELEATTSELENLKGYFNYCELAQRKTTVDSQPCEASQQNETKKKAEVAEMSSTLKEQEVTNWSDPITSVTLKEVTTEPPSAYDLALLKVFWYLTIKEICIVRAVCKQWQHVAQHPTLWRHVEIKNAMIPVRSFYSMAEWCTMTETIYLQGLIPTATLDDEDLNSYIARQKGCFEPPLGVILHSSSSTLKSITIDECSIMITQRIFWLISVSCPQLNELRYSSDEFPPTVASLWCLGIGCVNLTSLHLPPVFASTAVTQFDDQCLAKVAEGWPCIRSLSIGSPSITSAGLQFIVKHCQLLEHLCIMYSQPINEEVVQTLCKNGLQRLRSLTVMFTRMSPEAVACFIVKCPQLGLFELHIGYSDYFNVDPSPETISRYKMVLKSFEDLLRNPKICRVFKLKTNYN